MRSRSSGSSAEANQVSSARDSGIQEDETRHPASPNIAKRYGEINFLPLKKTFISIQITLNLKKVYHLYVFLNR